jgi:acyl carrier protein
MTVCPDDQVTIAADGEILIQAPTCMMQGYYKHDEDTAKVLQNGILHTGDLGLLDHAGKLHVNGRKKEVLSFPDGTKIFLPEYERALKDILHTEELTVVLLHNSPVLVLAELKAGKAKLMEQISVFQSGSVEIASDHRYHCPGSCSVPHCFRQSTALDDPKGDRTRMIERERVLQRTKEIIQENMPKMFGNPEELNENTTLNPKDGNVDSMGFILIITKLEAEFNAKVPDHIWNRITTLKELVDAIVLYSNS